jgi:hypothetical protein
MYNSYQNRKDIGILEWMVIVFMVLFYPLLVSMYTLLPPLIGIAGLIIIYNMNKNIIYTLAGMLYLIHIDLNLTLPLLLSTLSIILIHFMVYPSAKLMIRCKICLAFFLIILVDGFYYINLFLYDIVLNSKTIFADSILWFYILIDIIIGLLL